MTVDLIPVLPVKGKNLNEMINLVTKTLFDKKPPNWLRHLKGFMNRDRILPESFQVHDKKNDFIEVGLKLLHFGSKECN